MRLANQILWFEGSVIVESRLTTYVVSNDNAVEVSILTVALDSVILVVSARIKKSIV